MRILDRLFGRIDRQNEEIKAKLNEIDEGLKSIELRQIRMETRLCRLCEKMNVKLEGAKRCR